MSRKKSRCLPHYFLTELRPRKCGYHSLHASVETLHIATEDPQIPILSIHKTFLLPVCKRANQETGIAYIALYK